ncbi:nitroreductase/quinone reductase family protein [Nonomuraea sp. PA05]|uniref:nitroreductase/quinone reductase family protein n=1 Tax=Nonomuraea sp. PA05 TaxID=2604466 RepID=UPI001652B5A8
MPAPPQWYHNLTARPEVTVQPRGRREVAAGHPLVAREGARTALSGPPSITP